MSPIGTCWFRVDIVVVIVGQNTRTSRAQPSQSHANSPPVAHCPPVQRQYNGKGQMYVLVFSLLSGRPTCRTPSSIIIMMCSYLSAPINAHDASKARVQIDASPWYVLVSCVRWHAGSQVRCVTAADCRSKCDSCAACANLRLHCNARFRRVVVCVCVCAVNRG